MLERRRGVEDAEPDVGGAVADAEDPAVAGKQRALTGLAVPELEPRLQPVVVVARARVVGADRNAERPVVALLQPHRKAEPGRVAVGGDHDRGTEGDLVADLAAVVVDRLGADADDAAGGLVEDRAGDGSALVQPGAVLLRMPGQDVVEVEPGAHQAVVGVVGEVGPRHLEAMPTADDPQALVLDPARLVEVDAHPDELAHRARGQSVAADLLARERGLLEQQDVDARLGEIARRGRATRTGADDDDVGLPIRRGVLDHC